MSRTARVPGTDYPGQRRPKCAIFAAMLGRCIVEDLGNIQLEDCVRDQLAARHPDYDILVQGDHLAAFDTKLPGIRIIVTRAGSNHSSASDFFEKRVLKNMTADEVCRGLMRKVEALIRGEGPSKGKAAHAG